MPWKRRWAMQVTGELRRLRRLLYCGEWIESHALHVHMLHVPDFLGYDGGLAMAKDYPDEVNRGLQLKKHGNQLLDVLGGRAVHPVNVAVGGFYRLPRREELAELIPDFECGPASRDRCHALGRRLRLSGRSSGRTISWPFRIPTSMPCARGRSAPATGWRSTRTQFEQHFREQQVPHSTALQAVRLDTGGTYFLGPLARINLNREQLLPTARRLADEVRLGASVPQRVQEHRGPQHRNRAGLRRGVVDSQRLPPGNGTTRRIRVQGVGRRRGHRSAPRPALSPLRRRRPGAGDRGQHRAAHVAESRPDRGRSATLSAGRREPARRAGGPGLRAAGAVVRSLHQLLDALSQSHAGATGDERRIATGRHRQPLRRRLAWDGRLPTAWPITWAMPSACAAPVLPPSCSTGSMASTCWTSATRWRAAGRSVRFFAGTGRRRRSSTSPFGGSHDLSLPAVLALAETLGRLPAHVRIWGVAIAPGRALGPLSPAVAAAVPKVVERICGARSHA